MAVRYKGKRRKKSKGHAGRNGKHAGNCNGLHCARCGYCLNEYNFSHGGIIGMLLGPRYCWKCSGGKGR